VAGSRRPALRDYARANASIGINGAVVNSVNANPQSLTTPLIEQPPHRGCAPAVPHPRLPGRQLAAPKMLGA